MTQSYNRNDGTDTASVSPPLAAGTARRSSSAICRAICATPTGSNMWATERCASLSHSIVWNTLQDLCNLKNARELIGRDLLQGITGLCHIDRGAPTSPCILRGLAMYRGYIAHRVSLAHIAHIGAHIDILPSILCVYQYSTYLLYIANLVCISHHIRKSGIILPSYRFYIYITWYVVTCPHITG